MKKDALIFLTGGTLYPIMEIVWRGYSHYSMALAGGISLFLINKLCCCKYKEKKLYLKCTMGSAVITGVELVVGIVFNKMLLMNVWDYSMLPMNILGQICLPFSLIWFLITIPAIYICGKINGAVDKRQALPAEDHAAEV